MKLTMWHTQGHGQNFYNKFVTDGIQGNKNAERVIDEEAEENVCEKGFIPHNRNIFPTEEYSPEIEIGTRLYKQTCWDFEWQMSEH
mgnify:CR=1 FL=1